MFLFNSFFGLFLFLRPLLELAITQHVAHLVTKPIVHYPRYMQ